VGREQASFDQLVQVERSKLSRYPDMVGRFVARNRSPLTPDEQVHAPTEIVVERSDSARAPT
jgi:hypothetical protein